MEEKDAYVSSYQSVVQFNRQETAAFMLQICGQLQVDGAAAVEELGGETFLWVGHISIIKIK